MSTLQRQVVTGISISIFLLALFMAYFFAVFPIDNWSYLWKARFMDLPFALFALLISIIVGISIGFASGIYWRKQLLSVADTLQQIEQGRSAEFGNSKPSAELEMIYEQIKKVQKHMTEQAKLSQKLANEKAEDQEKRIQEIVSQERNRLARELHDSVSQQLFAASMMMSAINETMPAGNERQTKQLKMVEEMINQSQLEMRALLLHLRPAALKGKTLQEGIQELLIELAQKVPMDIKPKIEQIRLDKGIEDHLFRILQESVSNTLRHAKATTLEVLLIERDGFIILRVADDGVGFNVEEEKAGSYGLQNMYERAVEIGGTLKIVSLKDKGTRLEVKVPMIETEGDE